MGALSGAPFLPTNMKRLRPLTRIVLLISSLSLVTAYFVPLWQILMWAPQYPEGLEMKIWINTLSGDVKIISALNHYIGMRIIEPSMFPEFNYMIYIVGAIMGIGLLAALWNRLAGLIIFFVTIVAAGIGALVDFWLWGYDYGHNLNPDAAIKIEGMSYQPPLIGTKVLLNFTAFSGPDIGGWVFMGVALLMAILLYLEFKASKKKLL